MDIQGTHFQPTLLPGLDPNAPSLLLQAVPEAFLLQVTPKVLQQTFSPLVEQALGCKAVAKLQLSTACTLPWLQCSFVGMSAIIARCA